MGPICHGFVHGWATPMIAFLISRRQIPTSTQKKKERQIPTAVQKEDKFLMYHLNQLHVL